MMNVVHFKKPPDLLDSLKLAILTGMLVFMMAVDSVMYYLDSSKKKLKNICVYIF